MYRVIFFFLLILVLYYLLHFLIKDMPPSKKKVKRKHEPEELVQDPFCMTYIPKDSAIRQKIGDQWLYFCKKDCLKKYLQQSRKD